VIRAEAVQAPAEQATPVASAEQRIQQRLAEKHISIRYNDTGHSYASLFGEYLVGVKKMVVEDPYIRANHQLQNFVRLCELLVQQSTLREIHLITGSDGPIQKGEVAEKLSELGESLKDLDITLKVEFSDTLHDRAIRLDNGWVVKIGRGLDFYQRPQSRFELGFNDLGLRRCLETTVDIFRKKTPKA